MKINLQRSYKITKISNFTGSLIAYRILIISLLFSFPVSSYAQEGFGNSSVPTISLKGGAAIYSADQNFNKQIENQNLRIVNAEIIIKKNADDQEILIAGTVKKNISSPEMLHQKLASQEKTFQDENTKAIKKKIAEYESRKKESNVENIKVFPSSEKFIISSHINRDYVAPSQNQHDLSKINFVQNQYVIKSALDFLHQQKYTFYNNKSLDFCFSQVFYVRPPPFLLALI
ncbi:hypothetical protein [Chryseobacterium formosus]|uniref:hypothetical protein n=1 Tax=Chryseobacterium formosus TaxID=1537363 RepID=UPI0022640D8F|nr:hypothetical protein [Chryseobacterium formosus]